MDDLVLEVLATLRLLVKKSAVDVRHVSSRLRWTSLAPRLQSSRDSASLRMISFFEASSSQSTSHDVNVSPQPAPAVEITEGVPWRLRVFQVAHLARVIFLWSGAAGVVRDP